MPSAVDYLPGNGLLQNPGSATSEHKIWGGACVFRPHVAPKLIFGAILQQPGKAALPVG
jgi:hypothetical protein